MTSNIPYIYEGQQVSLRLLSTEDIPTLYQWRADWRSFVLLPAADGASTREEFAKKWQAMIQRTITLLAVGARDGQPIGLVQAYDINLADRWCFVLSYMTEQRRSQRMGIEATVGFWDYLFAHLNLRKIYSDVSEFNLGWMNAIPGLESGLLGREGRFVQHTLHDNQYWDVIRFAVYRELWQETRDFLLTFVRLGGKTAGQLKPDEAGGSLDSAAIPHRSPETAMRSLPARLPKQRRRRPRSQSANVEAVRRYLRYEREGRIDEIMRMVSEDIALDTPATGPVVGKEDVGNLLRFRYGVRRRAIETGAPMHEISWGQPEETGDTVQIVASVGHTGTIRISWAFNSENKIRSMLAEGSGELMARYVLSNTPFE